MSKLGYTVTNGTTSQKALVEFIQDNSSMGRDKARGFFSNFNKPLLAKK